MVGGVGALDNLDANMPQEATLTVGSSTEDQRSQKKVPGSEQMKPFQNSPRECTLLLVDGMMSWLACKTIRNWTLGCRQV